MLYSFGWGWYMVSNSYLLISRQLTASRVLIGRPAAFWPGWDVCRSIRGEGNMRASLTWKTGLSACCFVDSGVQWKSNDGGVQPVCFHGVNYTFTTILCISYAFNIFNIGGRCGLTGDSRRNSIHCFDGESGKEIRARNGYRKGIAIL